jgi:sigma-B regulation protein RsbU (phosphoserine phosphatase)
MPTRLERLDALMRELSTQEDPELFIRAFSRQADMLVQRDAMITVTQRDLLPPSYRVIRASRWPEPINPWTDAERLPVFDRGLLGELLYAGQPVLLNRLELSTDDPASNYLDGMQALACAPGYDQGRPINLVAIARRQPDSFAAEDLETLLLNANLLGQAANNLLLKQQLQETNRALAQEKDQVGRMQRHLLPARLPKIDGLELGASYFACSRAGGDYYDILELPEEQWGFFVADVSGHGTPAAVVAAMIHTLLHSFPGPLLPPVRVLGHINRHLLAVAPEGMFATAFYGVYDPYYRRLRYASAGHPHPRLRTASGRVTDVEGTAGMPLGVVEEDTWTEREVHLAPGDTLLLYTDGIVEGANVAGDPFGLPRLDEALRLGPRRAVPLVEHIERLFKDFCADGADLDDRTLLAAVAAP